MSKFVVTNFAALADDLCKAADLDPTTVRRVVLDLEVGSPGRLFFETFADDEKIRLALTAGIRLEAVE